MTSSRAKAKICLTNLVAFYDELTLSVGNHLPGLVQKI